MSKTQEQRNQEEAFKAGVEHTVRWLLENQTILYGPEGYGSAMKIRLDLGKADQIDTQVNEILLSHGL